MRFRKDIFILTAILALLLITFSVPLSAKLEKGKKEQITFSAPVRVGDVTLKPGDYIVQHVVGPEEHVMVFTQMVGIRGYVAPRPGKEIARVPCKCAPLDKEAERTELSLQVNPAGETVLKRLSIKGEKLEHMF